jgi:hypothetical protein
VLGGLEAAPGLLRVTLAECDFAFYLKRHRTAGIFALRRGLTYLLGQVQIHRISAIGGAER